MGPATPHRVTRRTRPRAYLALARVSNLPTIWTNVIAGAMLAAAGSNWPIIGTLAIATSLLYTGGMFLNDAFDAVHDAVNRPDRPIPAGEVTRREAFVAGYLLLATGAAIVIAIAPAAAKLAVALVACIMYYDWRHKKNPFAPFVMGACRGLVYCAAAAAVAAVTPTVLTWALVVTLYVVVVTLVAKYGDERWGWTIAWLIAGISIVDAVAIASSGRADIAGIALIGFPLTLVLQRWIRGT